MADEKWISGLCGSMPAVEAARRVLAVRLGIVVERLPHAVDEADEDIEHVHQLRVGTRRAAAAVRIFADCLPGKLHRRARRTLRAVRRAAGAARDWDVFLAMLDASRPRADAKLRPGMDFLRGVGHGQRVTAQAAVGEGAAGQAERFHALLSEIAALTADPDDRRTLRDLAVPVLTQLVAELEAAAGGDLSDYEALHQVRILGKQLRYAMELFESCFGPAFREKIYPCVAEMQEILGRANDSHVASLRLAELRKRLERTRSADWARYRPAFVKLQRWHQRRLPAQRRLFMKWWDAWRSAGHARTLTRLLRSAS